MAAIQKELQQKLSRPVLEDLGYYHINFSVLLY